MKKTVLNKDMIRDTLEFLVKSRDNFMKTIEADEHDFDTVLKALKDINLQVSECLIMENYLKDEGQGLQNKNILSQITTVRQNLQLFNQSLTAILRCITLLQRYKEDTGQLVEISRNKFGILYKDETSDCYLLFHLRSGWLQRFNFPYLTRSENQDLAMEMFGKMKHIENTN